MKSLTKYKGFSLLKNNSREKHDETTRSMSFWALTLSQTVQSEEADKGHIMCCLDVM